jgi:predicted nucleic acid-binding protein
MKLHTTQIDPGVLSGKYVFIDTNFLSLIFSDSDAFEKTMQIFAKSFITIDPLVRFEFLQSVFLPKQRELKERFLSNSDVFAPAMDHFANFNKIRENGLALSYIYAHNKVTGASVVDLLIAARALLYASKAIIVTENRKDFPMCIFDTLAILNYEDTKNGQIHTISLIGFSESKYKLAVSNLSRIKSDS